MIQYENSSFGFLNLLRVHGSPVYKVLLPTFLSTGFLLVLDYFRKDDGYRFVQHPYAIGAFVGFFSFLLTFRLNFAYSRYWEGATAVHSMISKWVDLAMLLAAFHYQADSFKDVQPPSFGNNPTAVAVDLQRERVQSNIPTLEETMANVQALEEQGEQGRKTSGLLGMRRRKPPSNKSNKNHNKAKRDHVDINTKARVVLKYLNRAATEHESCGESSRIPIPVRFQERFQQASMAVIKGANEEEHHKAPSTPLSSPANTSNTNFSQKSVLQSRHVDMPAPSLFFQELAHLVSLLTGVAMSTLRNHLEGFEAPMVEYIPGKPWPPVDPDELSKELKEKYGGDQTFWLGINFMFGLTRSERHRVLYNAARPFTVLGGVSDEEVMKLNRARGPYAKVALCTFWLQEFISREMLHGSVGKVHHALLSRLYQYASDGCVGYNQARKIAYIPFPFPHGQMTAVFSFVILFIFPVLFQSYVNRLWFACFLNTLTVLCFLGLHEVARELENPFQNVPNDLPLTTFQAQINEALVTMYAGYHPDAHWAIVSSDDADDDEVCK
ncbi:hypothetical protein ACA910_018629 [Epithemia clementina (nom. ined.)]